MIEKERVYDLKAKLEELNQRRGYYLNPDVEFTKELLESLLVNEARYGYQACPCRLATGKRGEDLDIICPCDYRDADIIDCGACYCGLYVSKDIFEGKGGLKPIPERRKFKKEGVIMESKKEFDVVKLPVWRCTVCGYLCARENPPEICPICGVAHDRFERFE